VGPDTPHRDEEIAMTTMTTAEVDQLAADVTARVARIAASDYRGRVELRKGYEQIILTIWPAAGNLSWEVAGVGIYLTAQGGRVGGTAQKFFGELADAQAYANGWFSRLVAKGYRRVA
jgi:hypothetical protein